MLTCDTKIQKPRYGARRYWALAGWLGSVALASSCGARSELLIPDIEFCTGFTSVAKPTQLDLFLLIDSSGSMTSETDSGATKWAEITSAIEQFVVEPALSGTGATISFFPERRTDIPDFCVSDSMCGAPDSCYSVGICMPSGNAACVKDEHCDDQGFPGETCEPLGQCQNTQNFCLPASPDVQCGGAPCLDAGVCTNRTICDESVYQLEDPQPLPNSANSIISAMISRELGGGTPTWPAMQGAINSAASWISTHPTRKAIVVLATDGMPSSCEPSIEPLFPDEFPVDNVIATVSAGVASGVATFVIGVFAPDEAIIAEPNLNAVANAGSESPAFIVTTAENVSQQFLTALLEVQAQATSCVYTAPWQPPDNNNIFVVRVSSGSETLEVPHRPVAGACGLGEGFYFATPPSATASDVQIALCPATCAHFNGKPTSIELEATCN